MNVENRRLFRNKDARARLAGMGGIIASSPELLGTVQKFQDAGPVVPSTFLVQLPGLVGGNEFLQLTAAELQLLNQKQPGLMSSEGVMIQEATPEILSTLNPAQINTTSNLNIKRMFTDLGVTLPESSVGAEGPSNRALAFEKLKEQLSNLSFFPERTEGTVDTGPGFFSPENNAVRLSAVKELMFGPEEQQAPQQQVLEPVRDSSGSLIPVAEPVIADNTGISSLPVISVDPVKEADRLRTTAILQGKMPPVMESEQMLQDAPPGLYTISALNKKSQDARDVERLRSLRSEVVDGDPRKRMPSAMGDGSSLESLSDKPVSEMSENELKAMASASGLSPLEFAKQYGVDPTLRFAGNVGNLARKGLATVLSKTGNPSAAAGLLDIVDDVSEEINKDKMEASLLIKESENERKVFEDELARRVMDPGVGGPEVTSEAIDKAVKEAEKEKALAGAVDPGVGGPEVTSKAIEAAMKISVDADKLNPQGPNFVLNPDKIKKDLDEGGSGSNALLNVEIDKKLSPKESVKEFQAMYKEMLGMDDEDKEKEKWHQMAMIGFAIAAGQDPSALANIAGGLLEGTKMMKADRVRKQDRADKITIMAIQAADQERRDAIAAGATVDAANLKYNRDIELIEKRAGIATDTAAKLAETQRDAAKLKAEAVLEAARLEQANTSFLGSDRGKQMAKIYSTNPTQLSDKEKLAEMSQTFDKNSMDRFRLAMGIVGAGLTGAGAEEVTLDSF